jgi:hypothetical protein
LAENAAVFAANFPPVADTYHYDCGEKHER